MRLSELQDNFKQTLLAPDYLETDNGKFRSLFRQGNGVSLENRMKVYRNNLIRSLTEAAMSALPMTKNLVGHDFLEQAVRAYVTRNLPQEGNLNLYGMSFPDFVKTYEPAKDLPYLHDFTRLEWLWEAAYYAQDDLPLDPARLSKISEEDMPELRFYVRASFALIESGYPLDEIVDFCRSKQQKDMHQLSNRGCKLMVYRPALKVELRRLDDAEYLFLKSLKDRHTIHDTVTSLSDTYPDADAMRLLQKHLKLGTFTEFEIRPTEP